MFVCMANARNQRHAAAELTSMLLRVGAVCKEAQTIVNGFLASKKYKQAARAFLTFRLRSFRESAHPTYAANLAVGRFVNRIGLKLSAHDFVKSAWASTDDPNGKVALGVVRDAFKGTLDVESFREPLQRGDRFIGSSSLVAGMLTSFAEDLTEQLDAQRRKLLSEQNAVIGENFFRFVLLGAAMVHFKREADEPSRKRARAL